MVANSSSVPVKLLKNTKVSQLVEATSKIVLLQEELQVDPIDAMKVYKRKQCKKCQFAYHQRVTMEDKEEQ